MKMKIYPKGNSRKYGSAMLSLTTGLVFAGVFLVKPNAYAAVNAPYGSSVAVGKAYNNISAADISVSGTISDENGQPLTGVSVKVKGGTGGTMTDINGGFKLTAPENATLVISYIGYQTKEVAVEGKTSISVRLTPSSNALNEVVVTSLGIKREAKSLGYAVSTVTAKQLTEAGNTNFASALYGKAAGVKVTTAPGGSSSAVNVQIRGINSLNYNQQPLYVVDGVMIRNDNQNGAAGANNNNYWDDQRIRGNGILDINPADIESLNVLKGASATALYGSDAASGVIVITTKKGSKSRGLGVDFNYAGTIENVAFLPKFQNIYGPGYDKATNVANGATEEGWIPDASSPTGLRPYFRAYGQFGPKMEGQQVKWWDGSIRSYSPQPNNYRDVYQTGYSSVANLAISNQTDKVNYRISANRMDYKGTQPGSKQQRNTFNLNTTVKLSDKLSTDVIVNYVNTLTHNRPYQLGQVLGSFGGYFSRAEDMDLLKQKSITSEGYKYVTFDRPERSSEAFIYNIRPTQLMDFFYQQLRNSYDETENRLLSSATINWSIANHLKFRGRIGNDFTGLNIENKQYNDYPVAFNTSSSSTGAYATSKGNYSILYGDALLTYNNKLGKDFDFTASAGYQARGEHYKDQMSSTSNGLVSANWFSLNNSYGILSTTSNRKELLKYAFLGILNLSYKNYLFVEGTARQEYASSLPVQNNTYFYPSVNTSFVFTDAFQLPKFLSYGKIRASYGVVGNAPPLYESNILYNQSSLQTINGSVPQLTLGGQYGNNNLMPEKKHEGEVGLEARMFDSRFGFDVSYYNNRIKNQILGLQTAASVGATSQIVNVGEIGSQGVELALNINPIRGAFRWDTRFNFAINRTKVYALLPGVSQLTFYEAEQSTVKIVAGVGEQLGNIYVNPRLKDANGNFVINEDGLYVMDKNSYVKAGNIMPKVIGGFSNTLAYKNFSLDFTIDYRLGGQMVSPPTKYMMGAGMFENTLQYRDAEHGGLTYTENGKTYNDGVLLQGVNQTTGQPNTKIVDAATYYMNMFNWGNDSWSEKGSIYDNSYIKMREMVIGYNIPKSFSNKLHINNLRVSLIGRNLFYIYKTLENLDPEAPLGNKWWSQGVDVGSTAPTRSFGFSLNANF
jgi:iron complex outermembrane receptor protein